MIKNERIRGRQADACSFPPILNTLYIEPRLFFLSLQVNRVLLPRPVGFIHMMWTIDRCARHFESIMYIDRPSILNLYSSEEIVP